VEVHALQWTAVFSDIFLQISLHSMPFNEEKLILYAQTFILLTVLQDSQEYWNVSIQEIPSPTIFFLGHLGGVGLNLQRLIFWQFWFQEGSFFAMGGALLSKTLLDILIPIVVVIGIGFSLLQWVLVSRVKVGPEKASSHSNGVYNFFGSIVQSLLSFTYPTDPICNNSTTKIVAHILNLVATINWLNFNGSTNNNRVGAPTKTKHATEERAPL
jgi:hypothetical protein